MNNVKKIIERIPEPSAVQELVATAKTLQDANGRLLKIVRMYLESASNPKGFSKLADIDEMARRVLADIKG